MHECMFCHAQFSEAELVVVHQAVNCLAVDDARRASRQAFVAIKWGRAALEALLDQSPRGR